MKAEGKKKVKTHNHTPSALKAFKETILCYTDR